MFEEVFPHFNKKDRLGIVVGKPGGGIGASTLYMAAITKYYDYFRPCFFHIGKRHMDHYWMDIWPPHKEVVVKDNPEAILEAINDRRITRLLVEDIPLTPATFLRETVSSAEQRIVTTLAYSTTGKVLKHDIRVTGSKIVEDFIKDSLKRLENLSEKMYEEFRNHTKLDQEGRTTESFRQIMLADALNKLTPSI